MEPRSRSVQLAVLILAVITLIVTVPLFAATGEVEIIGVIFVPDSLDVEDMDPVVLAGEDGEMYGISINEKWVELAQHQNKLVRVNGTLVIGKKGRKSIAVKHYEVLKE